MGKPKTNKTTPTYKKKTPENILSDTLGPVMWKQVNLHSQTLFWVKDHCVKMSEGTSTRTKIILHRNHCLYRLLDDKNVNDDIDRPIL